MKLVKQKSKELCFIIYDNTILDIKYSLNPICRGIDMLIEPVEKNSREDYFITLEKIKFFCRFSMEAFQPHQYLGSIFAIEFNYFFIETFKTLFTNFIKGLLFGYEAKLNMIGRGYRFFLDNEVDRVDGNLISKKLILTLGYSHKLFFTLPRKGMTFDKLAEKRGSITIKSYDLSDLMTIASLIKNFRPADIYKKKGIHILGEALKLRKSKRMLQKNY